jgi:hypothetical protein
MVRHVESVTASGMEHGFLSPLRLIRFCGQNASLFLTTDDTDHTDFKEKVTATVAFEVGAADPA